MRGEQLSRILRLAQMLTSRVEGVTVGEIARKGGVTVRTAYRDLGALELAGYPLYQERVEGEVRWRLSEGFRASLVVPFSVDELLALHIAREALPGLAGTSFANSLDSAFGRISATLKGHRAELFEERKRTTTVDPGPVRKAGSPEAIMECVRKAMDTCETVSIVYKSPGRKRATRRQVDPYRFHVVKGSLYLVSYCHLRKELRGFLVDRIRMAAPTGKHFSRVHEEEARAWYAGAFSAYTGEAEHVVLRFEPEAAPFLRERIWHSSQTIEEQDDRGVLMHLRVFPGPDLEAWIRSWGRLVEVIEPVGLRRRVANELLAAAGVYGRRRKSGSARAAGKGKRTRRVRGRRAARDDELAE